MQVTPVSKTHYRPIEAAIRWLGLLRYESVILAAMKQPRTFPRSLNCPRGSELRARTELLYDAIQNGDLPTAGRVLPATIPTFWILRS